MAFAHAGIKENELRLLLPISTTHERLDFQLLNFQRQYLPPYTAVSYTWGSEKPTEIIYLNGCVFNVTPNLWSCLYYLSLDLIRHQDLGYLWADAICIDQSNNVERNAQVRRMDATYRDAACVSVWLGLIPVPDMYESSFQQWKEPIKMLDSDGFDFSESMADLAHRPYWSRFWVIQEFLLCQNVILYCSGNRVDWLFFQELLKRHAGTSGTGIDPYSAANKDIARSLPAFPLVMSRNPDRFPELPQPLYDLVINHGNAQCKDPRDRVFALLGLIPQDERTSLERFFPDYTLSPDNVVVIALGHLMDFSMKRLTADSEDVFAGLGVKSRAQRKKLLRRMEHFDYLGSDGNTSYLHTLEAEDEWLAIEAGGVDESVMANDTEASRDGVCGRAGKMMLLGCLLLGAVIWIKAKQWPVYLTSKGG